MQYDEARCVYSEDPVWYESSGTTGTPRRAIIAWPDLLASASSRGDSHVVILLGYPVRTYAGLQVLAYARRHQCRVLVPELNELEKWIDSATHVSTTPSLMRRILLGRMHLHSLRQITLGGEASTQSLLDDVMTAAPQARITQIYASSDRGVSASWSDALEGIPLPRWNPSMAAPTDRWERRGERMYFAGRTERLVSIAGATVSPIDAELAIRSVAGLIDVSVRVVPSPLTGSVLLAEVVGSCSDEALRSAVAHLPAQARPRAFLHVPAITLTPSGKAAL